MGEKQQSEAKVVNGIKSIKQATEAANGFDVKGVEIIVSAINENIKVTTENEKAIEKMKLDNLETIEELKREKELSIARMNHELAMHKLDAETKRIRTKSITEAVSWATTMAAVSAMVYITTTAGKEVKLAKIREGHFE